MSETTPATAYLEVCLDGQTQNFPLGEGLVCRIGRATRNTVVLSSTQVSRDHALVDCPNGKFYVTDLGSLNGTHVNGLRIAGPAELSSGDLVTIGEFQFTFRRAAEEYDDSSGGPSTDTVANVESREITVLVADMRGYTALSKAIGAEKLSEVMGCFIRESGALLTAQGVWGQKYIGDAVMAIWMHQPDGGGAQFVRRALLSAFSIHEIAASLQGRFGLTEPVHVGVAVNSGFAMLGNLGSDAVADYTALGDTVNKAFRLEAATREAGCDVLVGEGAAEHLGPAVGPAERYFSARDVVLRGYAEKEQAHAVSFPALGSYLGVGRRTKKL